MALTSKPTYTVFFFLLSSLLTLIRPTSSNCYWPDGTDRNVAYDADSQGSADEYYAPCNPYAKASMCCVIGPGRKSGRDTCASNGLCFNPDGTIWWRESCTDKSWSDPACVQLYVNGTFDGTQYSGNDIPMTMCSDGSYCTGTGGAAKLCCDYHQGYFILPNLTVTQKTPNTTASASSLFTTSTSIASNTSSMFTTSTSMASNTSSMFTTSTSMASSTSPIVVTTSSSAARPITTSSSTYSYRLTPGAKAGISIGAIVAVAVILVLLLWVDNLRRSNGKGMTVTEHYRVFQLRCISQRSQSREPPVRLRVFTDD